MFLKQKDMKVPLLGVLVELGGQGKSKEIYMYIVSSYELLKRSSKPICGKAMQSSIVFQSVEARYR